ncbi:FxsA family protein [Paracoccus everestensis]|jgi:UPF0716 protein FxsA|uniref:FxsA family protein n=1 Tax=Paracoccus everestensis TaxID=2903900 RepID=UPI001F1BBB53|nr:FxsA family protein [Paracoccus everestensis]
MRMLWLFALLPIVEIALFIQVGGWIGVWATLGLVVLAAVAGVAVIRSQGTQAWIRAQRSLAEMRDPSRPLAHGMMQILAGALLIVPGFFTDFVALLLLIPPVRDLIMRRATRRVRAGTVHMARRETHRPPYADGVIDADYVVEDTPPARNPRPPLDLPEDLSGDGPSRPGNSGWTRH